MAPRRHAARALVWIPVLAASVSLSMLRAAPLRIAREGRPEMPIVLATGATAAERSAADELATYLSRITGGTYAIVDEASAGRPAGPALVVGPSEAARRAGIDASSLQPEEWVLRTTADGLVLCGGRPRGTLYAVYHFLEDHAGVRWWSQFEELVPKRRTLTMSSIDRRGVPAFSYRDLSLLDGTFPFCVRNRLNGNETRLPPAWGGHVGYATPWSSHSFFRLVPPERYFQTHPEYFSERAGFRAADGSQLCLTQPAVSDIVDEGLTRIAQAAHEKALRTGVPAPTLYDLSHNDWGGWCRCAACEAVRTREGADAGTLLPVVNRAAEAVRAIDPDARVTTLAYTFTFDPPREAKPGPGVIVALTGWGKRDFARPADDPANARFRAALEAWRRIAPTLWVWEYTFSMGASELGLPYPTYRVFASDLRLYRDLGVRGMIVQTAYQVPGDLRDLNVWVLTKLLEDPDRDVGALVDDFLHGFYGRAAGPLRAYLRQLERATARPPVLRAETDAAAYAFLDLKFVLEAQKAFDRAGAAVRGDAVLARRVRHARVGLDYATLARWPELVREHVRDRRGGPMPLDHAAVAARYDAACREQIELRVPERGREAEWQRIQDEREDATP